jgi:hypothetical protein
LPELVDGDDEEDEDDETPLAKDNDHKPKISMNTGEGKLCLPYAMTETPLQMQTSPQTSTHKIMLF